MRVGIHVVRRRPVGWRLRIDGTEIPFSFPSQRIAWRVAKVVAKVLRGLEHPCEISVHRRDGTVGAKDSYLYDPPPQGNRNQG